MPTRTANAIWRGKLKDGKGLVKLGSGAFEGAYSFSSRFEEGKGTNPEELLGAAHAGCFSMALSFGLEQAGFTPKRVDTIAKVNLAKVGEGFKIVSIELYAQAEVSDIEEQVFQQHAENAKKNCPISLALASTQIVLEAKLV